MRSRIKPAVYAACIAMLLGGIATDRGFAANANGKTSAAPVGHRQPTAKDAKDVKSDPDTSAEQAREKMDQELDRKLKGICRGC